jgi:Tfp pilus assembly protein PilO
VGTDKLREVWRGNSVGRTALLAVIVYMLAVGSSFFFLFQPTDRRLHEVRSQKDILHDYMVITQAGAAIGGFKDGLMTGDQRLTVMSEVTQMAEASGVRVIGDPELLMARDTHGSFSEYPMRVRAKGTFHEIGDFLSLLESSPRFVVVEEVEIRSDVASRSSESEVTLLLALAAWEG